ncbi:MAG: N-acetylneuraminate synthase family protein [Vicinamibacterales bacterium]
MPRELPSLAIGGRRVAEDVPPFVVAEIGLNHGGSLDRALALVEGAARAGAQAIKLQTLVARDLVSDGSPAPKHVKAASMLEFFQRFELDERAHRAIFDRARTRKLKVVATPLSERSVDMLVRLGVDAFKIASGDLTFDRLIVRCVQTNKPVVMSTGMATADEVTRAVSVARQAGAEQLALLHCVSAYPVPRGNENLRAIRTLGEATGLPVGLSDHGEDAFALPIAIALGACIYERHIVLPGDEDAIDRDVSSTPEALAAAIEQARRAWTALGSGQKACLTVEAPNRVPSRRSLFAAKDLPAGTIIRAEDFIALRPATGLAPATLATLVGRRLLRAVPQGQALTEAHCDVSGIPEHDRVA